MLPLTRCQPGQLPISPVSETTTDNISVYEAAIRAQNSTRMQKEAKLLQNNVTDCLQ